MDTKLLIISILEAIYIIYMFRYFKTTYSFNLLPLKFLDSSLYLKHQKYATQIPESHVCPFGQDISWVIGLFLIARNFVPCFMEYNNWILGFILIGCLLNLNCLVYFLPIIIVEIIKVGKLV